MLHIAVGASREHQIQHLVILRSNTSSNINERMFITR